MLFRSRHVPVVAEQTETEQPKQEKPKKEVVQETPKKEIPKKVAAKEEVTQKEPPKEIVKEAAKENQGTVIQNPGAVSGDQTLSAEERKRKLIERVLSAKREPGVKQKGRNTAGSQPQKQEEQKNSEPVISAPPPDPKPLKIEQKNEPVKQSAVGTDDDGDLTVHTVVKGETMPIIAKKYNVTVEQILKWNLLKSIAVRPGPELYIYVKK